MSNPEAFAAALRAHGAAVITGASSVIAEVGSEVERLAASKAPHDTGALAAGIQSTMASTVNPRVTIESTVDYGGYVEFGTSSQSPNPYLNPALDECIPVAESRLSQLVDSL